MLLIRAAEAPIFDLPGIRFTALAAPSRGSSQTCVWQLRVEPGLVSEEAHTLDHDEVFVVVEGAIRLAPDGDVASVGDAVVVPAGEPIQLDNAGEGVAVVHVAIKAGFVARMADGSVMGTPPWAA